MEYELQLPSNDVKFQMLVVDGMKPSPIGFFVLRRSRAWQIDRGAPIESSQSILRVGGRSNKAWRTTSLLCFQRRCLVTRDR